MKLRLLNLLDYLKLKYQSNRATRDFAKKLNAINRNYPNDEQRDKKLLKLREGYINLIKTSGISISCCQLSRAYYTVCQHLINLPNQRLELNNINDLLSLTETEARGRVKYRGHVYMHLGIARHYIGYYSQLLEYEKSGTLIEVPITKTLKRV